jgi:hypothetical protein
LNAQADAVPEKGLRLAKMNQTILPELLLRISNLSRCGEAMQVETGAGCPLAPGNGAYDKAAQTTI